VTVIRVALVAPFVDVTNLNAWVRYSVTNCAVGGTNNAGVVGTMQWTNALTGASGMFAAATPWRLDALALGVGSNTVTVTGTNTAGAASSDSVTITRGGLGTDLPWVDATTRRRRCTRRDERGGERHQQPARARDDVVDQRTLRRGGRVPAATAWQFSASGLAVGTTRLRSSGRIC